MGRIPESRDGAPRCVGRMAAMACVLLALGIAVLACDDGGGSSDASLVGRWTGRVQVDDDPARFGDMVLTVTESEYECIVYEVGTTIVQDGSNRGRYTYENGIFLSVMTEQYRDGAWMAIPLDAQEPREMAVVLDGDRLEIKVDHDGDGIVDRYWLLTRD